MNHSLFYLPCSAILLFAHLVSCSAQDGYKLHRDVGFYKLHTEHRTWGEAWDVCESEGAHLGIINDEIEAAVFVEIISQAREVGSHLGFHDLFMEGKFVTIFGTPLDASGYNKWQVGEPNDMGGGEDCGCMDHAGSYNDVDCRALLPFICEKEPMAPPGLFSWVDVRKN